MTKKHSQDINDQLQVAAAVLENDVNYDLMTIAEIAQLMKENKIDTSTAAELITKKAAEIESQKNAVVTASVKSLKQLLKNSLYITINKLFKRELTSNQKLNFFRLLNYLRLTVQYSSQLYKHTEKSITKIAALESDKLLFSSNTILALDFIVARIAKIKAALESDFNIAFTAVNNTYSEVFTAVKNETDETDETDESEVK